MNALNVMTFRRRLHEIFHPGMTCISSRDDLYLIPGRLSSRCLVIYLWVFTWFGAWFGAWFRCWKPGWRTRFCSKSCKHLQVNDQTPRWKSSRDEMKVIPGWNSSRDEITHVNGALLSVSLFTVVVFSRWTLFIVKHKNLDLSSEASNFFTVASLPCQHNW